MEEESTGVSIGIDLGTTNSVAAHVKTQPRIIENKYGKPLTRSVVGLFRSKSGVEETLIGEAALDSMKKAPKDTILSIKRLMGRAMSHEEVQAVAERYEYEVVEPADGTKDSVRVVMGGKQYSPVDISSLILKEIKQDAEDRLGKDVTHAVITVPAYFSEIQKNATRQAALEAGLTVIKVLEEPTAAAIAFGVEHGAAADTEEASIILVYDLGGGTFDISIMAMGANSFSSMDLEGDMWLGGDDFDQVLIDLVLEHCKKEHNVDPRDNPVFMVELRKQAQIAKEKLTGQKVTEIIVNGCLEVGNKLVDIDLEVDREQFNSLIRPLVDSTHELITEGLENAGITEEEVDLVLMVGGSTLVPLVKDRMEQRFGKKVKKNTDAMHCVGLGAAIFASRSGHTVFCQAPRPDNPDEECGTPNESGATICTVCGTQIPQIIKILDQRAAFPYGIQTAGDHYHVFVKKNDSYPTKSPETQQFPTYVPNQRMVSVPVYGGDKNLEKASANDKQGEAFVILPQGLPKGTPVDIKLWLNDNGIFDLDAHLGDGKSLDPWIVRPGELEEKCIMALQKMEKRYAEMKEQGLSEEELRQLEVAREEAFRLLKEKDFEGALKKIDDFRDLKPPTDHLEEKAENLIGFAGMLIQDYGWALPPDMTYNLNKLMDETREAKQAGDRVELEKKVAELDRATDKEELPVEVGILLGVKGKIIHQVQPYEPAKAAEFMAELKTAEGMIRSGDHEGGIKIMIDILNKIGEGPPPENLPCNREGCSGVFSEGDALCPACGKPPLFDKNKDDSISSASFRDLF